MNSSATKQKQPLWKRLWRRVAAPNLAKYSNWVEAFDTLRDDDVAAMRRLSQSFAVRPLISIVMPVYETPRALLIEAIDSVLAQTYDNWELCIADDASKQPHVREVLETYQARDQRIKLMFRVENGHISNASNSALELAGGEWIALLDHDDKLAPQALFCVVDAINRHPQAKLIYSDVDKIDVKGRRRDPYFKSDWNHDLFLSHNMIAHLGVYRADLMRAVGGFRSAYDGAQDYDLALRVIETASASEIVHVPHVLYHWRELPGSTAKSTDEKPYAMLAGERALNAHFERRNIPAKAEFIRSGYRIHYQLAALPPRVSVIIPTRNGLALLRTCLASILGKTTYPDYEIIVIDNGSDDPATLAYLKAFEADARVRVLRDDRPFNYSALNNAAVAQASGTLICLLNNDVEVITPDWLSEMASHALRPGVGAVGARLWFPNKRLQHGGVLMGIAGLAGHAHARLRMGKAGYMSRAALAQNFSAVTGACLVVRKALYEQVGGLNETDLSVAYNDVDFCLKLVRAGYRNVWTPFAELWHHESATRGYEDTPEKRARFEAEKACMRRTWPDFLANDPCYNPNLTLARADFSLSVPPRVGKCWTR